MTVTQEPSIHQMQCLFVPFACIGSGDPVSVLHPLHNEYAGYN